MLQPPVKSACGGVQHDRLRIAHSHRLQKHDPPEGVDPEILHWVLDRSGHRHLGREVDHHIDSLNGLAKGLPIQNIGANDAQLAPAQALQPGSVLICSRVREIVVSDDLPTLPHVVGREVAPDKAAAACDQDPPAIGFTAASRFWSLG